jgi:transcriptional regulator with XRE-family HTH domain
MDDDPLDVGLASLRVLLKRFRVLNALTQAELSESLGVSQATVSRWEKGTHVPDVKIVRTLQEMVKRSLPRQDRMLSNLVRYAGVPRVLVDRDRTFLAVSAAFANGVGCRREALVGACYRDLMSEEAKRFSPKVREAGFYRGEVAYAQLTARVPGYAGGAPGFDAVERIHPVYLSDGRIVALVDFEVIGAADARRLAGPEQDVILGFEDGAALPDGLPPLATPCPAATAANLIDLGNKVPKS